MQRLAEYLLRHGEALHRSFLIGGSARLSFARCLAVADAPELSAYKDASVVLAIPDQLRAAVALIALDGIARRIVLVPAGEANQHLESISAAAEADHVIEDWIVDDDVAEWPGAAPVLKAYVSKSLQTEWVLLTSGTTGVPKLVVHTLATLASHIIEAARPNSVRTWCTFYDTRRYGGLQVLLRALLQNETLVLPCPDLPVRLFLAHAARHRVTHVVGTPSHYRQVLMSGHAGVLSPAYVRLSGEIADQAILDRLHERFPDAEIVHAFASTEAGLAFEVADGRAGLPAHLNSVALPGVEAQTTEQGLRVRSRYNALGYLDRERRKLALADGFVQTGDLLTLQEGRYQFSGRHSGEVNIGGRKVHPEEVEAILYEHPAVEQCAVWARKNAVTGSVVAADVVRRDMAGGDLAPGSGPAADPDLAQEILAFCRTRLPAYKVPVSISFVTNLAVSRSGKLARRHA